MAAEKRYLIGLVSCFASRSIRTCCRNSSVRAARTRALHRTLFKKAVAWAERHGYEWFVISALHSPTLDQSQKI